MQKFYNEYYKMLHEILCVMAGSAIAIIVYFLVKASKEEYENKKVCVFDIDNTLTAAPDKTSNTLQSHSGYPASNFAAQAIKKCRDKGYGVAVATAESNKIATSAKQTKFLRSVGIKSTDPLRACQKFKPSADGTYDICLDDRVLGSVKQPMYKSIAKHFNVPMENLIIFDDDKNNLRLCLNLTKNCKNCIQASKNCKGTWCKEGSGLLESDFIGV